MVAMGCVGCVGGVDLVDGVGVVVGVGVGGIDTGLATGFGAGSALAWLESKSVEVRGGSGKCVVSVW